MLKKIVLTGGGTAGHVTANIALLPRLAELGCEVHYIGSKEGIEKKLIADEEVSYYAVSTGKFRRYKDLKNITDPFRVIKGYFQSRKLLKSLRPDVVFSKGGFVAVPVVWAASSLKIPVVSHESDMTPGLANRLSLRSASKVCYSFPETKEHLPEKKAVRTGTPIRESLLQGSRERGLSFCNFSGEKAVLMIIGGSLGAVAINEAVRAHLSEILEDFDIVHICGKGNLREDLRGQTGYMQYEYLGEELRDIYAAADLVISRAGANVINELLALRKPNILIPLPLSASRGDQILNAQSFAKQGFSKLLMQEDMEKDQSLLLKTIKEVYENREKYIASMDRSASQNGVDAVIAQLLEATAD